jgi:hypothetical protein
MALPSQIDTGSALCSSANQAATDTLAHGRPGRAASLSRKAADGRVVDAISVVCSNCTSTKCDAEKADRFKPKFGAELLVQLARECWLVPARGLHVS